MVHIYIRFRSVGDLLRENEGHRRALCVYGPKDFEVKRHFQPPPQGNGGRTTFVLMGTQRSAQAGDFLSL